MSKIIIFDFDGVIANTIDFAIRTINNMAPEYGFNRLSSIEILRLRDKNHREVIKKFNIPIWKVQKVVRRARTGVSENIIDIKPYKGIKDIIKEVKSKGYNLGILTTNSKINVQRFLDSNRIKEFDFIQADAKLFNKHRALRKVAKEMRVDMNDLIYIGDETRDVEAAQKAKVRVIAVTWGLNSKEALAKQKPDFIANKPTDIIKILADFKK